MLHLAPLSASSLPPVAGPVPTPAPIADTVLIPLHGKHGRGNFMRLNADDWTLAEAAWGGAWALTPNGNGRSYVTACRRALYDLADQRGSGHTSRLSRLLLGARRGEIVVFRDGDQLNLTRSNMELLNRKAAARWRKAQAFSSTVH